MILEAAARAAGMWALRKPAHGAIVCGLRAPRLGRIQGPDEQWHVLPHVQCVIGTSFDDIAPVATLARRSRSRSMAVRSTRLSASSTTSAWTTMRYSRERTWHEDW